MAPEKLRLEKRALLGDIIAYFGYISLYVRFVGAAAAVAVAKRPEKRAEKTRVAFCQITHEQFLWPLA